MNYKAQATAAQLASELAVRTGLVAAVDLSGADPVINVGTIGAGSAGYKIKVLDQRGGVDAGWDDIVGNQQPVYTGTVFQIAYEAGAVATTLPGFITAQQFLDVTADLCRRGGRVEWWSAAQGNAPAFTTVRATFDANLYWPLSGRA